MLAVKENQKALHALFQEHFPLSKMSEYEAQSIELEKSGQRGRRTVRTYTAVPFTEEFGQLCRGHWQIESMHWWLDSVMSEDDCRIMLKQAAQNLSRIRQVCLNMINFYPEKGTLKRRQMRCLLDTSYREKILFGD